MSSLKTLAALSCEVRPKPGELYVTLNEYHKNSIKNIRTAINRHVQDGGRKIDVIKEKEF